MSGQMLCSLKTPRAMAACVGVFLHVVTIACIMLEVLEVGGGDRWGLIVLCLTLGGLANQLRMDSAYSN
jgi:hypothetical protein